jgi:hypothetical protein
MSLRNIWKKYKPLIALFLILIAAYIYANGSPLGGGGYEPIIGISETKITARGSGPDGAQIQLSRGIHASAHFLLINNYNQTLTPVIWINPKKPFVLQGTEWQSFTCPSLQEPGDLEWCTIDFSISNDAEYGIASQSVIVLRSDQDVTSVEHPIDEVKLEIEVSP